MYRNRLTRKFEKRCTRATRYNNYSSTPRSALNALRVNCIWCEYRRLRVSFSNGYSKIPIRYAHILKRVVLYYIVADVNSIWSMLNRFGGGGVPVVLHSELANWFLFEIKRPVSSTGRFEKPRLQRFLVVQKLCLKCLPPSRSIDTRSRCGSRPLWHPSLYLL